MSLVVLGIIVVGGGLAWAAAVGAARREEETRRTWQTAARQLGLTFSEREDWRTIVGLLDGVPVSAEYKCVVRGDANTRTIHERLSFCAGGDGKIPASLVVRKDSSAFGLRDPAIGDPSFDDHVELSCVDAYVCAALSDDARSRICLLLEAGGLVREGRVVLVTAGDETPTLTDLKQTLRSFARLARVLAVSSDSLHQRLATNATGDPSGGVRLQNLRCLVDPTTRTPAALLASVARRLLADERASVRLLAAKQLGRDGHPVLLALAADEGPSASLRVDAIRELHEQSAPALHGALPALLGSSTAAVVCAALSVIASRSLDDLSGNVLSCTSSEHAPVRAEAATTLAALSPEREAALFPLLADPSTEVQRASAEALGRVGSVAAVEPLLPLARALVPSPLRHAARDAVARIQSRLAPVGAGALTLVGDDERAGAVALAEASSANLGAVSVAESDAPEPETAAGRGTVSRRSR